MVTAADTLARAEKLMRAAAGANRGRPGRRYCWEFREARLLRVWVCAVMALLLARISLERGRATDRSREERIIER